MLYILKNLVLSSVLAGLCIALGSTVYFRLMNTLPRATEHRVANLYFGYLSVFLYDAPGESILRIFMGTLENTAVDFSPNF